MSSMLVPRLIDIDLKCGAILRRNRGQRELAAHNDNELLFDLLI